MAENKRYYWLQLKEDFFRQKEIKLLRKIAGGDTFTIIYLKIMLISLKSDGKLLFEGVADNFAEEIALEIDEEIDNVILTIKYLQSKGLLVQIDETEGFMSEVPSLVGSETDVAKRVRKHRATKDILLQGNTTVTIGNTEIEIEKDLDIQLEKEKEIKPKKVDVIYSDDIELNEAIKKFINHRKANKSIMTDYAIQLFINKLNKLSTDIHEQIELINTAIECGWKTVYPKQDKLQGKKQFSASDLTDEDFRKAGML